MPWIIFAVGITSLGVMAYQKKFDLVREDYYAAELDYSNTMEKMKRGAAFKSQIKSNVNNGILSIDFPANFKDNPNFSGVINFYRPSDMNLDTSFNISLDENLQQVFPANSLKNGYWEVKYEWNLGSLDYLLNDTIIIE